MLKQAPYRGRLIIYSPNKKNEMSDRKESDILSSRKTRKSRDTQI